MSIVLRKSNKKKQKLHNKQVLYNTHYKNFYSGVPSSHCHWRKPLCGVELPTGCFQERHGYKKKTFAQLITRLNHFLCQALKRRATQKHAYCAVRQYLAQWRLFPRKSHIINNYLCNPEKQKKE
ncbi:HN1_G0009960.mRNA.1.CDS.1 [Saccharomyces cerevisiae]|nr:HN1_G0009960.mRNA.1.CDS.1 [Saccharomyces cerevisiae]